MAVLVQDGKRAGSAVLSPMLWSTWQPLSRGTRLSDSLMVSGRKKHVILLGRFCKALPRCSAPFPSSTVKVPTCSLAQARAERGTCSSGRWFPSWHPTWLCQSRSEPWPLEATVRNQCMTLINLNWLQKRTEFIFFPQKSLSPNRFALLLWFFLLIFWICSWWDERQRGRGGG